MNPFRYRPHDPDNDDDWADNWLSNGLAWASEQVMPNWCSKDGHWTAAFTEYTWADCPCCHLLRGVFFGLAIGGLFGVLVGVVATLLLT